MFLYNFIPNPILLNLGFFQIRWYGVILALAVASGFLVFSSLSRAKPRDPVFFKKDDLINLLFYTVLFAIIGGRLVHVLSFAKYYSQNLLEIFYIWNGGIAFYGVFGFGLFTLFLLSQDNFQFKIQNFKTIFKFSNIKQNIIYFFAITDIAVIALSLSQSIGRWGNYFNQELFGKPCDYFWCIPIEHLNFAHFHPVFLYESILMFLVFCILLFIFSSLSRAERGIPCFTKNNKISPGIIFAIYLILHAVIRFFLEFLRLDIQPEFLGLRLFQYFAVLEFLIGIVLVFLLKKWYNKKDIN